MWDTHSGITVSVTVSKFTVLVDAPRGTFSRCTRVCTVHCSDCTLYTKLVDGSGTDTVVRWLGINRPRPRYQFWPPPLPQGGTQRTLLPITSLRGPQTSVVQSQLVHRI